MSPQWKFESWLKRLTKSNCNITAGSLSSIIPKKLMVIVKLYFTFKYGKLTLDPQNSAHPQK
ncbi:hypothetical protein SAMN06265219_115108 [Gracilimonas mengyeensis]|uniref:Uncharacterized protein n=1 Tax=Gracilimonas mengyeensis TaxID=1302730 RepID=A0A521F6D4_9BACT|nr:hypothetical protein SAMN06265219_115108 [Gracilimonas mengyeensis]